MDFQDVNNVIESHPDMILKDKYIAIKKVNWLDKVTNIRKISKDLNIGLDSIIFIDDSPFEVNLVRSQLPELKVVKVPSKLHKYTEIMRNILGDFYNLTSSNEDESKTRIYKEQLKRHKIKKTFSNIDEYLSSLCLEISISENSNSIVDRISQISLKTNQFNLTTRRYTETDIFGFIEDTRYCVYSLSVCDKYGDYGSTGLAIILINGGIATIDTFLISCRIIGRYIEFSFIDYIINKMRDNNVEFLNAKYIKTGKNNQTENFYEDCGFDLIETSKTSKIYSLKLEKYTINGKKDYIEVIDE